MKAKKIFQELQQKYPELTAEEFIELGDLYFEGKVVKPDLIKSYQMYSKAAELGCDEAKIKLIARIGRYDEVNILTKRADLEDLLHYEKMAKQYLNPQTEYGFNDPTEYDKWLELKNKL